MAKYEPLRHALTSLSADRTTVTFHFSEIEALVGPLPASARAYRPWWANKSGGHADSWQSAGWHVSGVNFTAEQVSFTRRGSTQPIGAGDSSVARQTEMGSDQSEAAVQARLVAFLQSDGWEILRAANTATRERGTDVLARRAGVTLAVEVKGFPSRTYADPGRQAQVKPTQPALQARHLFGGAVLRAMIEKGDHPDYVSAIALPDEQTYRNLAQRIRSSLDMLQIPIYWVRGDGTVTWTGSAAA